MTGFGDGSGISWTICKQSAPLFRQIITSTLHPSIFTDWMLFLMPNQQCQSQKKRGELAKPGSPGEQPRIWSCYSKGRGSDSPRHCSVMPQQHAVGYVRQVQTRSSAIAEGPRDASCQLKSCQLPCNSAETTCTTSPEQIKS